MALTGRLEADFSKFVTACAQAEVSLKGLDTRAGTVSTSLTKMVDSFSGRKIIQDATLMAEAVSRVGGAATLTAAEQVKVNRAVTEAIEKYKVMGQEAPQALTDLAAATTKVQVPTSFLSKTFGDLGTQIKATALGFISAQAIIGAVTTGFRLLTDFVGSSVASFAEAEAASRKLEAALKAQGNATPGLAKQYDALANNFQKTTVFADDLITEMQALLVQVGNVGPQQMEKALTAATDLASGLGIDLRTATLLVGKAFEGETGTLKKYGIVIDEAKLKTQGITAVLDAVQEKFGGQAQAEIDTYAGKVKQLANAWDDVKESVGGFIVQQPVLQVALNQVLDLLRGSTSATGELTEATDRQAKSWFGADLGVFGFANGLRDGLRIINDVAIGIDSLRLELEMLSKVKPPATFGVGAPILLEGIDKMMRLRQEAENLVLQGLKPLNKEQQELIRLADKAGKSVGEIATKMDVSERAVKKYLDAVKDGAKAHEQMQAAMDKAADAGVKAFTEWHASLDALDFDMGLLVRRRLNEIGEAAKKQLGAATDATITWIKVLQDGMPVIKGLGDGLKDIGEKVPVFDLGAKLAAEMNQKLEDQLTAIFAIGDALSQIGSMIGGGFGSTLQDLGKVTDSIGQARDAVANLRDAQATGAATLGATVSVFAAQAAVAYGVWKAIIAIADKLDFNAGNAQRNILRSTDALEDMNLELRMAGVNATKLWDIKGQAAFDAAFARAQRAIEDTNAAMQEYGLTWRDFTNTTQDFVSRAGRDLVSRFDRLTAAGVDSEKVLRGMSGGLSQLVVDAVKTGTKLPAALRPILEQLIRMGGLTDAAARAMLGLEADTMPALADIKDAAERYGLTLDQLGPKVQQLRITETAAQIVKDFDLLILAGADVGVVMLAMKDQVQGLVTNALKLGLQLPESMRPLLQAMIAAGLLTDEFGVKLTDVSQLTFAETLTRKIDELIVKLGELIDEMSGVGDAAEEHFGRARHAAEILGRAVPRNLLAGAEPGGGTATPRPGSEAALAEDAAASATTLAPSVQANEIARGRVLQFPPPALPPLAPSLASEPRTAGGAAAATTTIILELDSRQVAEAVVPQIPGVVQRYGLA